jgi:mRNA-degrading endonuclease RelE of RelBE toxin-antitoxin system
MWLVSLSPRVDDQWDALDRQKVDAADQIDGILELLAEFGPVPDENEGKLRNSRNKYRYSLGQVRVLYKANLQTRERRVIAIKEKSATTYR